MNKDYKQLAIQYHLAYTNLKQRIDLSQRAYSTLDFKIQLEQYYQSKLKSVMDKYEDHKYDEIFQFIITNCSNKYQVQEQLITDMKNAKEQFTILVTQYQQQLINIHEKKEKSILKLKQSHQKLMQSWTFYQSITKVYERNILTLDLVNQTVDQRLGHMKIIADLAKNKENTFGNYKVSVEKYNQQYQETLPELEQFVQQIKDLEVKVAESVRQLFQKIALAEVSALRNRQYDLDQVAKYLDKVDFSKIFTVFKFVDETFQPIKIEPLVTYSTKMVDSFIQKYNLANYEEKSPQINKEKNESEQILEELEQAILEFSKKVVEKQDLNQLVADNIEKQINSQNANQIVELFSTQIKAPICLNKQNYQILVPIFNKLLDQVSKEGIILQKIQRISTFIYYQADEIVSLFQQLSQSPIFSKKTDYWEWLIFWQITQTCEGVSDSDKPLIIFQQFQNSVQQMGQSKIPIAIINTFITDLAPYYGIKSQQSEEIKKLLSKFIIAQQQNPNSKAQIQSFDSVE